MPKRCIVTFQGKSLAITTTSLYQAVINYRTRVLCNFPEASGYPLPETDDVLYVEVDGKVTYKVPYGDAWAWANREADRMNQGK